MKRPRRRASGHTKRRDTGPTGTPEAPPSASSRQPANASSRTVATLAANSAVEVAAAITPRSLATPIVLAGLAAIAMVLAIAAIFAEAALQTPPHWATATAIIGVAGGAALGLWLPRRFIVRQLISRESACAGVWHRISAGAPHQLISRGSACAGGPVSDRSFFNSIVANECDRSEIHPVAPPVRAASLDTAVASGLCGGLLVLFAMLSLALRLILPQIEPLRSAVVGEFLLPIAFVWLLIGTLLALCAVLVALVAVTLLVALHGWLRMLAAPHTPVARLWMALLGGSLIGLFAIASGAAYFADLGAACIAFIAAAIAASARVHPAATVAPVTPSQSLRPARLAARRRMLALGAACAVCGALGVRFAPADVRQLATIGFLASASFLSAFAMRHALLALPARITLIGVATLLAIALLGHWIAPASGLCAACVASLWIAVGLARHLVTITGSVQAALARVGASASLGLVAGACFGAIVVQSAIPNSPSGRTASAAARSPLHELVPTLCTADAATYLDPIAASNIWNLERTLLAGDLLLQGIDNIDAQAQDRLFTRLASALPRGGRLIIECPPEPAFMQRARALWRARRPDSAWLLELTSNDAAPYRALILGRDAPAWIAHFADGDSRVRLQPLDQAAPPVAADQR